MRHAIQRGFTLIELLVVVSVIAILVAMVLPALGKAKTTALRVRSSTHLRGMTQGIMVYAADRKNVLPSVAMSLGTDPVWFKELLGPNFDFTPIFKDYGLMPLTAHPVLGSPRFDDAGNSNAVELAMPWYYFPGVNSGTHECTVPNYETQSAIAPTKLDRGQSSHVMMQDQLVAFPGAWGANLVNTGAAWTPTGPAALNVTRGAIYVTNFSSIDGVYTGTYDGAVTFRKPQDARWAGFYYNNTAYSFAHYQPK